jgi:hypothetical protein
VEVVDDVAVGGGELGGDGMLAVVHPRSSLIYGAITRFTKLRSMEKCVTTR